MNLTQQWTETFRESDEVHDEVCVKRGQSVEEWEQSSSLPVRDPLLAWRYGGLRGGMKASPSGGEITPLIISPIWGGELQTWVRGAGIDIPISANNESFPLGSEGGLGKEDGRGEWEKGDRRGEERRERWGCCFTATHIDCTGNLSFFLFSTGLQRMGNIPIHWLKLAHMTASTRPTPAALKPHKTSEKKAPTGRRLEEKFPKKS